MLDRVPGYVWTFVALISGILLGGFFPELLNPVASGTKALIRFIVAIVPILIFFALSPAIATLVKRGLAGKFAGSVILWFVATSAVAGLWGVIASSFIFGIPFSSKFSSISSEIMKMFQRLGQGGASMPLLSIVGAVAAGFIAIWIEPLYKFFSIIQKGIARAGRTIAYAMIPLLLCFGVTIGVNFGARLGMGHYITMGLYSFILCFVWWLFYVFIIIKSVAKQPVGKVLKEYFVPTGLIAAGTCSSMATLPVNLIYAKKYGVRDEIADFVIPFGAVFNMDGSALAYIAFAPFILAYIYHLEVSWTLMFIAWPAHVLFTIASPGLPAPVGTALWSSTLFTSMIGLQDPARATVIATWLALCSGFPDMFITTVNSTDDGFSAITFHHFFDRFFKQKSKKAAQEIKATR
ncbi:MAG: dicarboxylate/amino acid:cation symporter [Candidatus Aminicenantes bacterium]|nr:dicarboxylate/amino acid:cation symporter [Candidatus Aminicenantes bacterium]